LEKGGKKMGFSLVAAFSIICVSVFIAFEIFSVQVLPVFNDCESSYSSKVNRYLDKLDTKIIIEEVILSNNLSNYDYNISVNNTGEKTLRTNDFNIIIDGKIYDFVCNETYLLPLNQANFYIYNVTGTGDIRLKVVTGNGIKDYKQVSVGG
jgi:archaellum component FlaF (FlaF/FlaG flagellin family)